MNARCVWAASFITPGLEAAFVVRSSDAAAGSKCVVSFGVGCAARRVVELLRTCASAPRSA